VHNLMFKVISNTYDFEDWIGATGALVKLA